MATTIEQLELEVRSSSSSAVAGIEALKDSLGKLKLAVKGGVGLTAVAKQLTTLNSALSKMDPANADTLNKFAKGMETLSACGNLKLSSSIASQLTAIGTAVGTLNGVDFSALGTLANSLTPLMSLGKSNLGSFISQFNRLPAAVASLNSVDTAGLREKLAQLVSAMGALSAMGKNNLSSFITSLRKIPKVMEELKAVNMAELGAQIQQLVATFAPLANQMQQIAAGFAAFPTRIQRMIQENSKLGTSNKKLAVSYVNLAAKVQVVWGAMSRGLSKISDLITKSNDYGENLSLFAISMGEYAKEAKVYADTVGEVMGIDPGAWMRDQGTFMTITKGFGVASDRAYVMSQNLTQLGYDISSFFNINYEDSMAKLQSGIAGELEPLRRLGYDLSNARLQEEAYALGIKKKVTAMTQAEKAELRYYTIMTQVTEVQGDMARTLEAPANQLRVLKAQVEMAGRAIGNIFIPALNAILPYAIAAIKVVRMLADVISSLFGFSLPEMDYGGLSSAAGGAEDMADGLSDAAKGAKKLKNALLGIDELNVISPSEDSGAGGADVGGLGGLGFELPTYDFIGNAVSAKVDEIVRKMKEWLGLTEPINSWADFFHTKLGRILVTVGAIGLGFAAWKITSSVLNGIGMLTELSKAGKLAGLTKDLKIGLGVGLAVTGVTLETAGIIDAIQTELNKMNLAQIVGGGGLTIGGGALLGSAFGATVIGGAIGAIVAGVPAFFVGIYDACVNGINWLSGLLIGAGATAAGAGIGAIIGALGGPIGAGVGALIGLVIGLYTDLVIFLVQKRDEIIDFFVKLPETIPAWFEKLWAPIKEFDWAKLGYDIGKWFGEALKKGITFVTETVPKFFKETLPEWWNTIKGETVTFFTEKLPEALGKIDDYFVDVGSAIIDGIWEGLQTVWTAINEFVGGFVQGFKDALGIHSPSTVFLEIGGYIVEGLLNGIKGFTRMKDTVKQWASNVVEWFTKGKDGVGIVDRFKGIANDTINGFKNKIDTGHTAVKGVMDTFGSNVTSWFKSNVSYDKFYNVAADVISGFKNGISNLYRTCRDNITKWGSSIIDWFKGELDSHSPSKVFMRIGEDTVLGYNLGIEALSNTTTGVVDKWTNSFTSVSPTMKLGVDTSALKYYNSDSFASSISSNVTANASMTATGFKEGMEEFYREYVAPTMVQMASDMRRQADKNEKTVVQIGNRVVSDAVTTQKRANGYVFAQ